MGWNTHRVLFWLHLSLATVSQAIELNSGYFVGNSLTWDADPARAASAIRSVNPDFKHGYHIACSRSLHAIEADPDFTCIQPTSHYGKWKAAFETGEFDFVVFQPFPGATGDEEVAGLLRMTEVLFAEGRNEDCILYLYIAWPGVSDDVSFTEARAVPYSGGDQPTYLSSGFADWFYATVQAALPERTVRLIPAGAAYEALDRKLSQAPLGALDSTYALYRDALHMSIPTGRYVAHVTMLSILTGEAPDEMPIDSRMLDGLDADYRTLVDEVVWSGIQQDPRTGVATEQPRIALRKGPNAFWEISFVGRALWSEDLEHWHPFEGDTASPLRFVPDQDRRFFKVE